MTRQEIRSAWPEGAMPPAPQTLWRWLERLVKGPPAKPRWRRHHQGALPLLAAGHGGALAAKFHAPDSKGVPAQRASGGVADIPRRSFRNACYVSEAGLPLRARCRSGWLALRGQRF